MCRRPQVFIALIVPEIRGNEWRYIKECLDTNWVSSVGSYVDRFEKLVAERAGTPNVCRGDGQWHLRPAHRLVAAGLRRGTRR